MSVCLESLQSGGVSGQRQLHGPRSKEMVGSLICSTLPVFLSGDTVPRGPQTRQGDALY